MEVRGQLHAHTALPPGKQPPGTHCIGGWVGPRTDLDVMEKRKILPCQEGNTDSLAVQPVA
jgi:hypothetical protein